MRNEFTLFCLDFIELLTISEKHVINGSYLQYLGSHYSASLSGCICIQNCCIPGHLFVGETVLFHYIFWCSDIPYLCIEI